MSQEFSRLLAYGSIQSDTSVLDVAKIPPQPKRARRWLKSAFDYCNEAGHSNVNSHENSHDAVASLRFLESLSRYALDQSNRKILFSSIQSLSISRRLAFRTPVFHVLELPHGNWPTKSLICPWMASTYGWQRLLRRGHSFSQVRKVAKIMFLLGQEILRSKEEDVFTKSTSLRAHIKYGLFQTVQGGNRHLHRRTKLQRSREDYPC